MGSKGSQTTTTNASQTYTPNPQIGAAGSQAITGAQAAAQLPFQMPAAPVAGFTPFQNQSFNEIAGLQGFAQPYFNTGAGLLGASAAPVTSQDVSQYYNPMAQNVTAQMQNIFGQQNVQNTGNLVQEAGGVGADRVAVGQANMANQQALAAGQTYAGLYQSALQAAQQQKQMEAGAGYGIGQMGPAALAAQQNEINQLLGAGGMQQQLSQAQQNALYQQQLAQIAFPYQQPQYLAGITAGLAPAMGGTTAGQSQTTYPAPSALAQALGVGTSLMGLGGMFGGGGGKGGAQSIVPGMYSMGSVGGYGSYGGMGGGLGGFYNRGGPAMADGGNPSYGMLDQRARLQELGNLVPAQAAGNPIASEIVQDVGGTGYDDGGSVIKVGDVVPLDPFGTNESLQNAFDRLDNRKTLGASGLRAANPLAVDRAKESGVLKIFPSPKGMDDGGSVDDSQQSMPHMPMGASATGYPTPGANPHIGTNVIPTSQLPQGQGGKSGPFGQYMMMHDLPRAPSSGGSGGTSSGAPSGNPSTGQEISMGINAAEQILPMLMMAEGGSIDDYPTIGPGAPPPPKEEHVPLPRPRPTPPPAWHQWSPGHERDVASTGGMVTPMHMAEGYDDGGDVDFSPIPTDQSGPSFGSMLGDTISQTGTGLKHYGRMLMGEPPSDMPPPIPPEAQSVSYAPPAKDIPVDPTPQAQGPVPPRPSWHEQSPIPNLGQQGPDLTNVAPPPQDAGGMQPGRGIPFSTINTPAAAAQNVPMSPFGHGDQGQGSSAPLGAVSPTDDMSRFRRATMQQETWLPGERKQDPYQNTTTTRNRQGQYQTALGAYGIMDFNLPQWSQEALGRQVSKQEFLSNPKIQDAIYDYKMGQYLKRYGPEGAGRAWLGGEGSLNAPNAADPFGTTVGSYGRHFASLVGQPGGGAAQGIMTAGMRPSGNVEDVRNNVGMRTASAEEGPMGGGRGQFLSPDQLPYPNATRENWGTRAASSPWMSLVKAGAAMASTTGPIGTVLARGIGAGAGELDSQRTAAHSDESENLKAQQLYNQAQQHRAQMTEERHRTDAYFKGVNAREKSREEIMKEPEWQGKTPQQIEDEVTKRTGVPPPANSQGVPMSVLTLPPNPSKDNLQVGKQYQTARGIATWDGTNFVQ